MSAPPDRAAEARAEIDRVFYESLFREGLFREFFNLVEVTIRESNLAHELDVRREYSADQ
jgi:hypothetical protein